MTELPCIELGCSNCCRWGDKADVLKPNPKLKARADGTCTQLDEKSGLCISHGTVRYPKECAAFDCTKLMTQLLHDPVMRVMISAIRVQFHRAGHRGRIIH